MSDQRLFFPSAAASRRDFHLNRVGSPMPTIVSEHARLAIVFGRMSRERIYVATDLDGNGIRRRGVPRMSPETTDEERKGEAHAEAQRPRRGSHGRERNCPRR